MRTRRKRSRRGPLKRIRGTAERVTPEAVVRWIDVLFQALLIAMILLAPLPLGSVAPWARSILFVGAGILLCLWIVKSSLLGRVEIVRTRIWGLLLAYVLILCFQLVPLPHAVLSALSPGTAELYSRLIPGFPDSPGLLPLSLNAHATTLEIYRVATLFILFFVLVNQVRERWQVSGLLWALVALGLFQALYGLGERFSGNPHIFWVTPPDRVTVHGTYYNKNHFAGLMEMLTPAVFGFLMAFLAARRRQSWRTSGLSPLKQLSESLSKAGIYRNVLLGLLVAAMFVCGVLSLSRGGILGLLVAFLVLFLFAATRARGGGEPSRARSRLPFAIVAVLLIVGGILLYQGLGTVIDRFEQLTEEDSSWSGRAALRGAGLAMIRDFPLLGSGGGTFGDVFPAYQPPRYGDRVALYLHNDWLQVACETGLAGALLLCAALGILAFRLLRQIGRRTDGYCRFVFAGAGAGVAAMLVHSFFDFNLYMVPANGIVFVVLAAICHAAAHMKGRRTDSAENFSVLAFPVSGRPLRALLPAAALAVLVAVAVVPVKTALANVAFSRYLAWASGEPDHYYFWRPRAPESVEAAKAELDRASRLAPSSPELAFHQGLYRVRRIDEQVRDLAREIARGLLLKDYSFDPEDPVQSLAQEMTREVTRQELELDEESPEFKALVSAFQLPAKRRLQERILAELGQAEEHFRRAIRISPTVPWHHMDLAVSFAANLVPGPELDRERPRLAKLVEDGIFLAPNRPATLYRAGWYRMMETLHAPDGRSEEEIRSRQQEALAMFTKAIEGAPGKYAYPVYTLLLDEVHADPAVLPGLTPATLASQAKLFRYVLSRRLWPTALEATANVLTLLGIDTATDLVPQTLAPGSLEFRIAEQFSRARLQLLRRIALSRQASKEDSRYRRILDARCHSLTEDASRFAQLGRLIEAGKSCRDCLDLDWNNLDALLLLAEIHGRPGMDRAGDLKTLVLDDLMRALNATPALAPQPCERVAQALSGLEPATPAEHLKRQYVESLRALSCGSPEEAARTLQAMLLVKVPAFEFWHQRHLIHHQLGKSLEASGHPEEAVREYQKALDLAPAHRDSLVRLAALGADTITKAPSEETAAGEPPGQAEPGTEEPSPVPAAEPDAQVSPTVSERLLALTPETPWEIDFSGKIRLLGTRIAPVGGGDVSPSADPLTPGQETPASAAFIASYFWRLEDDLDPADYEASYRYFNADGSLVFVDRRPLAPPLQAPAPPLDRGIGTVHLHQQPIPLPLEVTREVDVQVRRLAKGKLPAQPLKPATGETWLTLGLLRTAQEAPD